MLGMVEDMKSPVSFGKNNIYIFELQQPNDKYKLNTFCLHSTNFPKENKISV